MRRRSCSSSRLACFASSAARAAFTQQRQKPFLTPFGNRSNFDASRRNWQPLQHRRRGDWRGSVIEGGERVAKGWRKGGERVAKGGERWGKVGAAVQ